MKLLVFCHILLILLLSSSASAQNLITFDDQEWNSDQSLDSSFTVGGFSFSSNKKFYTNYGYNFDVYNVSIYYVFQEPPEDQFVITASDNSIFTFSSVAAYQVSENSIDTLIIEGWKGLNLKYTKSFLNIYNWQILNLNYNDIDKIVFKLGAAGNQTLTDLNFDNFIFENLTEVENTGSIPKNFALSQNYPNPFNPSTIISYQLAKAGKVTLKVFDILGNEIATLENGYKKAGTYNSIFNADNLSSGIYIYRLIMDEFVSNKKMMLIK